MKKILLLFFIAISSITLSAQLYDFAAVPVCWDSAGVKTIQLWTSNYESFSNTDNIHRGYFDRTGLKRTAPESELTDGYCGVTNLVSKVDTTVNISCMLLTRQMVNTVDASILYPKHELEKHTFYVGSQVVDTKFFVPHSSDLVTSPVLDISTMGCDDFSDLDFGNMWQQGDTITVPAGDTVTISMAGYASVFSILCDGSTLDMIKMDFGYENVSISGNPVSVGGTKSTKLRSYSNSYYKKWEFQRIVSVKLIGFGTNCECNYEYSNETQKF